MKIIEHPTTSTCADFNQRLETLISRAQQRSGLSHETFVRCITENAFRSIFVWSEYDMERLLVACEALQLSPVGREVFAIKGPDQRSGIQIVIGLDGWLRLMDQHPAFEGIQFIESEELEEGVPSWIECTIYRRDRRKPISAKEYLSESRRAEGAWLTHPRRMLRNKSLVQCARLAFALPSLASGVYQEELNLTSITGKESPKSQTLESHGDSSTNSGSSITQDTAIHKIVGSPNSAHKNTAHGPSSTQQLLEALAKTSPAE